VRLLGKGGMGEVYEAEHIELGAKRAIKIILPEHSKNIQYVGLFIEEARKLSRVNNDAIVRYYEFSRDEVGARYLVMEFVAGESLAAILEQRRFEPVEVLGLLERLAQGLAAAYDQGIRAHRDISPANILLPQGRADQAKVIDFGIAKSADPAGVTLIGSDFAGKYSYVSPEQVGLFGGQEQVNEKSDIYSLGLLLAAAALGFGKRLDMGAEPASVIRARQSVPDLTGLPVELRPLLSRMLQPRPQDRPESMRALLEDAKRLIQRQRGADISAPRHRPGHSPSRRRVPAWQLITGGVGGVVLIVAAASFALWPRQPVGPPPMAENPKPAVTLTPPVAAAPTTTEAPNQQAALPIPPPVPPSSPDPSAELSGALKSFDCASLHTSKSTGGAGLISGTVPDLEDQAKLLAIAARLPSDARPEIHVEIVPPPLCRSVLEFDALRTEGLVAEDGIDLRLAHGSDTLHTGDPIAVNVKSLKNYAVNLRVDYFTLTGDVLHMWPNADIPTAQLGPGETRKFLDSGPGNKVWQVGGAPFGTEYITVIATAQPLDFDAARPAVEPAGDYLRQLKDALQRASAPTGQPNVAASVFVHTAGK
jgi:serine/threonine protein kinase